MIRCRNLVLGYDGNAVAEDIDFYLKQGDYLCIVGENGAGKSTLMKTVLHLLEPVSGEVIYDEDLKPYEIGYLPQQTEVQRDFPASVQEIVLSGNLSKCKGRFFYSKKEKLEAEKNMKRMSIWELRNSCFRELSGGQRQRVLLARALCATSKLIVLDEPVSGLDPRAAAGMYGLIGELNSSGLTIIMVSHDIEAAMKYAGHILHIGRKQLFFGTSDEYRTSSAYRIFGNTGRQD